MSTVRAAIMTSIGIVSVGFLLGQYLQPSTHNKNLQSSNSSSSTYNFDSLHGLTLSELKSRLENLQAIRRNIETERLIALNKLFEVERRMQLNINRSSSQS
ncbi:hypothetical protein O181_024641 [Austropuccinia psidii MF-1]|uniref:Uncharacterized protein n=1 Tax=Austropuccinia psidii MF-1 TaxID=1389203 RepID=A0A9Q3CLU2_9BASI|nr:hypothetical protein [Austropuccinia psidii MF-1]